jgi:magnesium transporter
MAAGTIGNDRLNESVLPQVRRDLARISVRDTVGQALEKLRNTRIDGPVVYFYVVDEEGRLQGVVPTRGLLLSPIDMPVAQIMVRRVIVLPDTATLMDACELFIMHRLMALPVVDDEKRLIGIVDVSVYTDEVRDLADREVSNDLFQLIGVRLAQVRQASILAVFRRRLPWLACNVVGGLICALLTHMFSSVLEALLVLALFIPVVLSLSESVSIQSLTLTLQAQHGRSVIWSAVLSRLMREVPVGALLGLVTGSAVGLVAWLITGRLRLVIGLVGSIALSTATAVLLGMLVPIVLWSIRRDAKVASGPIALALVDVCALAFFFGVAAMLLTGS